MTLAVTRPSTDPTTTRQPLWRRATASTLIYVLILMSGWSIAPPRALAASPSMYPPLTGVRAATGARAAVPRWTPPRSGGAAAPAFAAAAAPVQAEPAAVTFFGPKRYTRTAGPPNQFHEVIPRPAWVQSPFTLRIENGDANGSNRITSAEVTFNGQVVAGPSDFKQTVGLIERTVTIPAGASSVTLDVRLQSGPGRYLTISLGGVSADTDAVDLVVAQPADRTTTSDTTPALELTYADVAPPGGTASGVDTSTLRMWIDDTERTSWLTLGSTSATGVVPAEAALALGEHTLRAEVRDLAGNLAVKESRFTIGITVPQPTITSPTAGALVAGPAVPVTGTFPSGFPGPLAVSCDVGTIHADGVISGNSFSCGLSLPDGSHTIQVALVASPTDQATTQVQVTVDGTAPALAVATPADGAWVVEAGAVAVSGTVMDLLPVAVTVNGVAAAIDGSTFSAAVPVPPTGATLPLVVVATDAVGNRTQATRTVNLARTPLTVAIATPAAGAVLPATGVEVRGTTNADIAVAVDVNGVAATVTNGQFVAQLTLPEGQRTIVAIATDAAGRTATASRSVTVDTGAPSLTITSPTDGFVTNAAQVHVTGTVSDSTTVDVVVNGVTASVANGEFAADVPSGAEGTLVLSAVATDAAGHAVTRTVNVVVDRTAPTLAITAPAPDSTVVGLPVVVQGTAADATALQVTVDGVAAALTGSSWQVSFASRPEGPHTFAVVATDAAGNTTSRSVTVTIERPAPTPTITAPADHTTVRGPTVTISGTLSDDASGLTASCDAGAVHAAGVVTGSTFTCDLTLGDGPHTIVVTLQKSAGNQATAQVQVTVDGTAPTLAVTSPADGSWTAAPAVTVSGTVSDATTGAPVTVTVNGVQATVSGEAFTLADVAVPGAGSPVTFEVVATDGVGNAASQTVSLYVARAPLTITLQQPAEGAVLRGPIVEVRGTTSTELPVQVDVNGEPATVTGGQFTALIPLLEGARAIQAIARDAAGRTATADRHVVIDTIAPVITITAPTAGHVTKAAAVQVSGAVADVSAVTVQVNGVAVPVTSGTFTADVPITAEGPATITITATDVAGNTSTGDVGVVVDRTAPTLEIAAPTAGALVTGLPIVVQGVATDATALQVSVDGTAAPLTDGAWQASFASLADGPHTFTVVATDAAGNATTRIVAVTLDTAPPVLTITSPTAGTLTRNELIDVSGTVVDASPVTVSIGGRSVTASGGAFTLADIVLAEGDNTLTVVATDGAGRATQAAVVVTRDATPPTLQVTSPERITRELPGEALASVSDTTGVSQVVLRFGAGEPLVLTAAPFALPLTVPTGATVGQTVVVTVTATDRAGNVATVTRGVRIGADGAIVGQVLSDATGLPLAGATVTLGETSRTTDAQGRYTLPTAAASAIVTVSREGMTSVVRATPIAADTGTVPVDARLTPLAAPTMIATGGGVVSAAVPGGPTLRLDVPAGAMATDTAVTLTPLSPQGLPDLLPLGWSPLVAFDLRTATPLGGSVPLTITLPEAVAQAFAATPALRPAALVEYRPLVQTWQVVARDLLPTAEHEIAIAVPRTGAFALVTADGQEPALETPAVDQPLTGVPAVLLPFTTTTRGEVSPAVLPPTGGTAEGRLAVYAPAALPSGTIVQAEIGETFTLPSGDVASEELRRADLVLYRAPAIAIASPAEEPAGQTAIAATFPIAASRTFNPADLVEGRVHLDILAGREAVRGTTGGRDTVTSTDGDARLIVPGGALTEDTAVRVSASPLSTFLPTAAGLTPLAEVVVDLSGEVLMADAELSFGGATAVAGQIAGAGTFVLARVERVDGVPFLTPVALAALVGDRLVPQVTPDLPGVRQGGRYVAYHVAGTVGRLRGVTRASEQPVSALVSMDTLPFAVRSGADGRYALLTLAGPVTATARVPNTALQTQGSATVVAGDVATLDLTLAAQVTTAVVAPADGARAVPRHVQFAVTTSAPLQPASVAVERVALTRLEAFGPATPVPVRVVLAGSGRTLSIVPSAPLDADRSYRLEVAGLVDTYGALVVVAPVTIQTVAEAAPTYTPDALTASFPDAQGRVTLAAPAGSFPSGTQFLVINATSGEVISFTAVNDGSVSARIGSTIHDRLVLTITDPDGRVTTVTRSQFVDAATGQTAIGPGGGVVTGEGGVELRVPEGATTRGVRLAIAPVPESVFPVKPDLAGMQFGAGVRLDSPDMPTFQKEVDIAFAVPQAAIDATAAAGRTPRDAVFYVLRRLEGPDGEVLYQTLDYAQVEGEGAAARVVTASFPFLGLRDFVGAISRVNDALQTMPVEASYIILMWSFNQLFPGVSSGGVISGEVRVLHPTTLSSFAVGAGWWVTGTDSNGVALTGPPANAEYAAVGTLTDDLGRYVLYDSHFTAGTVRVATERDGQTYTASVFTVPRDPLPTIPGIAELVRNPIFPAVGHANITVPPAPLTEPAPAITLKVFRTVDGHREDIHGLVVEGTPLTLGASASGGSAGLTLAVNGQPLAVHADPAAQQTPPEPLLMQVVSSEPFTPPEPGTYTVVATVPSLGVPVTQALTFRVLAAGGGVDTDPDAAPAVLDARTLPRPGASGVPVAAVPQLAFSEPVRNVPGHVRLLDDADQPVAIRLSGVGVDGNGAPTVIDDVSSPAAVVTSVTLQPLAGLQYGKRYRLVVSPDIRDLDPEPKTIAPYESGFTTFALEAVPGPDPTSSDYQTRAFAAPGVVTLGDRAYVLESAYAGGIGGILQEGRIRTYDMTDPILPPELGAPVPIRAAPRDIAGERFCAQVESTATCPAADEQRTVVVTTMPRAIPLNGGITSGPGTLLVYDATPTTPTLVGGVTLSDNIEDGVPTRVVVRDGLAYVATWRKGLQVVNLNQARASDLASQPEWQQSARLFAPGGEAVNPGAVVATIPVAETPGAVAPALLLDLEVGEYRVVGVAARLIVATGSPRTAGLVIADPTRLTPIVQSALEDSRGALERGEAVALGRIANRDLAVVGGFGSVVGAGTAAGSGSAGVIAIVDLAPLALEPQGTPTVLSWLRIDHAIGDLLIRGDEVFVSSAGSEPDARTTVVSLADPASPQRIGTLSGLGGRLTTALGSSLLIAANKLLLTDTSRASIRAAALERIVAVGHREPIFSRLVRTDGEPRWESLAPASVPVAVLPTSLPVSAGELQLFLDGEPFGQPVAVVGAPERFAMVSQGTQVAKGSTLSAVVSFATPDGPLVSAPRIVSLGGVELLLDVNNDARDDDLDERHLAQHPDAVFAFWEADPRYRNLVDGGVVQPGVAQDFATVRISVSAPWPEGEVRLTLNGFDGAAWTLAGKVGESEEYLSNESIARRQLEHLTNTECARPGERLGVCRIDSAGLLLPEPTRGKTEYLFRCETCRAGQGASNSDVQNLSLTLSTPQQRVILDNVGVDIRPFQNWASAFTAKQAGTDRPAAHLSLVGGWSPLPTGTGPKNSQSVSHFASSGYPSPAAPFPKLPSTSAACSKALDT
jgi:hypothetical protein